LQVTQLSPLQLIAGKLTSSLAYFLLLLVAVAPIMALPLLFGGMSFGDVFAALAIMLVTALMIGSVSLAISARARSSRGAVAGSYVFSLLIAFFTLAMLLAELLVVRGSGGAIVPARGREVYSAWLNPYVAMVDSIQAPLAIRLDGQLTPFTPIDSLLYARQGISGSVFGGGIGLSGEGGLQNDDGRQLVRLRRGPIWLRTVIIYVVVSALALMRAGRIVRAPASRPFRLKRYRHAPT
ncbi:MAG: hypothetical protein ACRDWH_00080, partial [Acidimicrobiia bacterium]